MTRIDTAALAHMVIVVLSLAGVISTADTQGAEPALAAGIAAAAGLVANAVVVWKYIHHHAQEKKS